MIIIAGALSGTAVGPQSGGSVFLHEHRSGLSTSDFLIDSITISIEPLDPVDGDEPDIKTNGSLPVGCLLIMIFIT
jgi:hypothetical protein